MGTHGVAPIRFSRSRPIAARPLTIEGYRGGLAIARHRAPRASVRGSRVTDTFQGRRQDSGTFRSNNPYLTRTYLPFEYKSIARTARGHIGARSNRGLCGIALGWLRTHRSFFLQNQIQQYRPRSTRLSSNFDPCRRFQTTRRTRPSSPSDPPPPPCL